MPINFPDQTIAAQVPEAPNAMTQISQLLDLQTKRNQQQLQQQSLRSGDLNYQVDNTANQKLNQLRDIAPKYARPDGSYDNQGYAAEASGLGPDGQATAGAALGNQGKGTANASAQFQLQGAQKEAADAQVAGLAANPAFIAAADPSTSAADLPKHQAGMAEAIKASAVAMQRAGVPMDQILERYDASMDHIKQQPQTFAQALIDTNNQRLTGGGVVSANQPNFADNGQQLQNINPMTPNAPTIQKQLPVTTPVMGPNQTPGYLGPQNVSPSAMTATPGGMQIAPSQQQGMNAESLRLLQDERAKETDPANQAALDRSIMSVKMSLGPNQQGGTPPKSNFVASGLPIGASNGIAGTQEQINKHWTDTQASANTAQQDIGVLQNIKQHAAGAATGVLADRQAFVAGLAGLIGMKPAELAKTDTDLLAKNSNMLALAGGDTNAARAMAEAATPNGHMTKEAITAAADQVIAQRKLALARSQFLTPFKAMADQGHPEMYNNALNQFNSVADPKVIQFDTMTPEEKSSMKTAMTPAERTEFGQKLAKARQLRIAP